MSWSFRFSSAYPVLGYLHSRSSHRFLPCFLPPGQDRSPSLHAGRKHRPDVSDSTPPLVDHPLPMPIPIIHLFNVYRLAYPSSSAGALITANAHNQGMFIGGRFLTGLGCTTASTSAKSYLAEITSPSNRGRWMGLLNSFYYVGQIIASGISIPFGRTASDYAWRAPIYLQAVFALINVAFVMFLPESPRWLYTRGRKERAVAILAKLHSRDNDVMSPLVQLEIQEIEENISLKGADKTFWDFRALFRTAAARYRFMLCAIVSCWGQLSGNGLITCECIY